MIVKAKPGDRWLAIPLENDAPCSTVTYYSGARFIAARSLPLACTAIDRYLYIPTQWLGAEPGIELHGSALAEHATAFVARRPRTGTAALHYTCPYSDMLGLTVPRFDNGCWRMNIICSVLGEANGETDRLSLESDDLLYWRESGLDIGVQLPEDDKPMRADWLFSGRVLGLPCENGLPHANVDRLRVWERIVKDGSNASVSLRFRVAPGVWPSIRILPAEGKPDDITAPGMEIVLNPEIPENGWIQVSLLGHIVHITSSTVSCAGQTIKYSGGPLRLFIDAHSAEAFCREGHLLETCTQQVRTVSSVDTSVTGNIVGNVTENAADLTLRISCGDGAQAGRVTVYGLRGVEPSAEASRLLARARDDDRLFYNGGDYAVYANRIVDRHYGKPDAVVIDAETVVSPVRVVEEFDWRENQWGDMVRVINRSDVWHKSDAARALPNFTCDVKAVCAAANIALDTLALCTDRRYTLPGQDGMWAAGLFQGEGEGFGVWMRDSAHIALRSGSLFMPDAARRTLLYTVSKGFDNGCDGAAMAIVGLWDYYLATGDKTALLEAYPALLANIKEADSRFDEARSLVRADMSTSNDAFPEPENGGYCLSTEVYYMKAYEDMAKICTVAGDGVKAAQLAERASRMHKTIVNEYWNEQAGCYCSGPRGTVAYDRVMYEASGTEASVWRKFSLSSESRRARAMEHMKKNYLSPYGIVTFPCRPDDNHFCHSVWAVWTAGYADAAAALGDSELIHTLIAQLTRASVINKTFYEVIDRDTGLAWRWPGQLWHAMGFLSVLVNGVFGAFYNEDGLRFTPAAPAALGDCAMSGLNYNGAVLDLELCRCGKNAVMLDGREVSVIPRDIHGRHQVTIMLEE